MIKLVRIDDRLVHGQVAFTWVPSLDIDCLLVANDLVAKDDFQKMTLGLARPAGAKLLIKSVQDAITFLADPRNKASKILILTNSVADSVALAVAIPEIKSINLGGLRGKEGARSISKAVSLTPGEIDALQKLIKDGIEVEVRQVPSDPRHKLETLI